MLRDMALLIAILISFAMGFFAIEILKLILARLSF
jgi:hypothetical protein